MNQKLTVLFYLNKAKINKKGTCPIYCRVTYQKKRKQFSSGQFVNPKSWDAKLQQAVSNSKENVYINSQLLIIKEKIRNAHLLLQLEDGKQDLDQIIHKFLNKPLKEEVLVSEFFTSYLNKLKKIVDKEIKLSTFKKFEYLEAHISNYIKWKFKKNDIPFEKLDLQFLEDLDYYLKTEKNQKQITINKNIQRFKKIVRIAFAQGVIEKNPFLLYKTKPVKKEIIYLTPNELKKVEDHRFSQKRLDFVRELFLFCCYTGLGYFEMSNLKESHIQTGFDGEKWIKMKREKTSKEFSVPLLPMALNILQKYYSKDEVFIFPPLSNQKFNSYLKEISAILGIEKRLTHHTARKTFATTILLFNDVPMEIVSELLGHSNMTITQAHYGKIVQKKVSEQMKRISIKLK